MQRLTKYRLLVGALAVATVVLASYCALLTRDAATLRTEAAEARSRATASDVTVADRERSILRLKSELAASGAGQSNLQTAVRAFARQAEVCEAVKQQLHIKE